MRTPLLALILPICLSACLDSSESKNNKSDTIEPVATVVAPEKKAATPLENKAQVKEKLAKNALKGSVESIKVSVDKLKALIADPQCDTTEQCKTLPVGSRACGGPSSFVVYSDKTADESELTALSAKITEYERNLNAKNDMASICQHLSAPVTQCIENTCIKIDGSAASEY
jgi:uncharacterized phage infection (PIP) family protein YhgE